jgi:hypothetical protein
MPWQIGVETILEGRIRVAEAAVNTDVGRTSFAGCVGGGRGLAACRALPGRSANPLPLVAPTKRATVRGPLAMARRFEHAKVRPLCDAQCVDTSRWEIDGPKIVSGPNGVSTKPRCYRVAATTGGVIQTPIDEPGTEYGRLPASTISESLDGPPLVPSALKSPLH